MAKIDLHPDFKDFLKLLHSHKFEYFRILLHCQLNITHYQAHPERACPEQSRREGWEPSSCFDKHVLSAVEVLSMSGYGY